MLAERGEGWGCLPSASALREASGAAAPRGPPNKLSLSCWGSTHASGERQGEGGLQPRLPSCFGTEMPLQVCCLLGGWLLARLSWLGQVGAVQAGAACCPSSWPRWVRDSPSLLLGDPHSCLLPQLYCPGFCSGICLFVCTRAQTTQVAFCSRTEDAVGTRLLCGAGLDTRVF